jgi:molybdopterin synthase sulfur carrier subunit
MDVKFFAYFRDYTHTKEINIKKYETIEELLKVLCSTYGKTFEKKVFVEGKLSSEVIILVNGRHIIHCDGINTRLSEGDEISIFPVVAGG